MLQQIGTLIKEEERVGATVDRPETLGLRKTGDFVFLILEEASMQF